MSSLIRWFSDDTIFVLMTYCECAWVSAASRSQSVAAKEHCMEYTIVLHNAWCGQPSYTLHRSLEQSNKTYSLRNRSINPLIECFNVIFIARTNLRLEAPVHRRVKVTAKTRRNSLQNLVLDTLILFLKVGHEEFK